MYCSVFTTHPVRDQNHVNIHDYTRKYSAARLQADPPRGLIFG